MFLFITKYDPFHNGKEINLKENVVIQNSKDSKPDKNKKFSPAEHVSSFEKSIETLAEKNVLTSTIDQVYQSYFEDLYFQADEKRTARVKNLFLEIKKGQSKIVVESLDPTLSDAEILNRQETFFKLTDMKMHFLLSEEKIKELATYEKALPRKNFLNLARQTIGGSYFKGNDAEMARSLFVDFSMDYQMSEAGIMFLMTMEKPFDQKNIQKRRQFLKEEKEGRREHMMDLVHSNFQNFYEKIENSQMSHEGKQYFLAVQKESESLAEKQMKESIK